MSDIFEKTTRPKSDLFFTRNDKNDPRLGEIVGRDEKDYEAATL
jgi:hypothetical protein